jgi:restriction system protein
MKNYYRVMLGKGSSHFTECFDGNFIGTDFDVHVDLTNRLPEEWRKFNKEFIPIFLENRPEKSRISAGLACGALWTVSKGIKSGDRVLCPDGSGRYRIGEVSGDYYYVPDQILPHRRRVVWLSQIIDRADMSLALKNSTGSIGTVSNVSGYADEIEKLLGSHGSGGGIIADGMVEDAAAFAMEKHLEDFLVQNWKQTELGKTYDIFQEDGELVGQQYPTDTGPMDVLAISKDRKELLVVELKRGKASDSVVGQIQRYMGYVLEELAEENQTVRGAIIALDDDLRIRRALKVAPGIDFYRYEISFTLKKA